MSMLGVKLHLRIYCMHISVSQRSAMHCAALNKKPSSWFLVASSCRWCFVVQTATTTSTNILMKKYIAVLSEQINPNRRGAPRDNPIDEYTYSASTCSALQCNCVLDLQLRCNAKVLPHIECSLVFFFFLKSLNCSLAR